MKYLIAIFLIYPFLIFTQSVKILEHNWNVKIEPIIQLNSSSRECNLSVSPDGRELFYMSTRASNKRNGGNGDLYKSSIDEKGNWSNPTSINVLNTSDGEDEPSISSTGQFLYFQSWADSWISSGGPYYVSKYENGDFKSKQGLGGGITDFFYQEYRKYLGYATDGMAVSPDGKLFIVACGNDYDGEMDLYFSQQINGEWTFLKKMNISTSGDERSVFIAGDNKTIYFSSNGYNGLGGMDIYKTTFENGKTGPVVNIGEPFNSKENDMGFVITKNGNSAFLIRNLDIYFADLTELDKEIKPIQEALEDTIVIKTAEITKEEQKSTSYTILFDFDGYSLDDNAIKTLTEIANLKEIKKRKLSIIGHTDSNGDENYNLKLSEKRVESVKNWLQKNNIPTVIKDFKGEQQPIVKNNNPNNRSKNRRVEILIE